MLFRISVHEITEAHHAAEAAQASTLARLGYEVDSVQPVKAEPAADLADLLRDAANWLTAADQAFTGSELDRQILAALAD